MCCTIPNQPLHCVCGVSARTLKSVCVCMWIWETVKDCSDRVKGNGSTSYSVFSCDFAISKLNYKNVVWMIDIQRHALLSTCRILSCSPTLVCRSIHLKIHAFSLSRYSQIEIGHPILPIFSHFSPLFICMCWFWWVLTLLPLTLRLHFHFSISPYFQHK